MKFTTFILVLFSVINIGCGNQKRTLMNLDIQGHRGCRGLFPENTLPAFNHALELGVTTLEMDLAITGDHLVIVSHEPFFNHEISLDPEGNIIPKEEQLEHNIYKMPYERVKQYDVGLKAHPRFPSQKKLACYKPLLSSVFDLTKEYCRQHNKPIPYFNIEIKSKEGFDGVYHPPVDTFVNLALQVISEYDFDDKVTIQSFDTRALNYLNKTYPNIRSVYLIENKEHIEKNLQKLNFTPDIYSPDYNLIDSNLVENCKQNGMKLIPWTVNDTNSMKKLIHIGVDGIITDYPDLLIDLIKK